MQRRVSVTQNRSSKGNKSLRNGNPSASRKRTYPCKRCSVMLILTIFLIIYSIPTILFFYLYNETSSEVDSFEENPILNQKIPFQQHHAEKKIIPSKVSKSNQTNTDDFYLNIYHTLQNLQDKCSQKTTQTKSLLNDLHGYIHTSHTTTENHCVWPPTTSCAKSFSVVIVFDPMHDKRDLVTMLSQKLRTLFLNILTLINMPNLSPDITVIYRGNIHDLRTDKPYGQRIWNWSLKGQHRRIRLVYSTDHGISSIVEDLMDTEDIVDTELLRNVYFPLHSSIVRKAKSDILLFLDGVEALTDEDTGGADSIQAGFDLIRLHSSALVGNEDGVYRFENKNEKQIDMKIDKEAFIPICDEPQISARYSRQSKEKNVPKSGAVLSFHGLFLHRSYSCYIWDKPLDNFRDYMNSISLSYIRSSGNLGLLSSSLSILVPLARAHSEPLFVYPTLSQTWTKNDPSYAASDRGLQVMDINEDMGGYDDFSISSRKRHKRLATESAIRSIHDDSERILTSESAKRILSTERKTNINEYPNQEPNLQQRTSQVNQMHPFALSEEMDLKKILQYFGAYMPVELFLSKNIKSKEDLSWRQKQMDMCP